MDGNYAGWSAVCTSMLTPSASARRLLALPILAAALAGCGILPVPRATPPGPLLTITAHGGHCPAGTCQSVTVIERDGRAHQLEPELAELRRVPPELLQPLVVLIGSTDFAGIKARPFTGECPTAYDGQELIFEFSTSGGIERIASCEVEVDPAHPLFQAVEAAYAAAQPGG